MRAPDLSCSVEVHADGVHLIAAGEIDFRTRESFDETVRAVLTGHPSALVLDLTAVTFVSSEGMAGLVEAAQRAADTGTRLVVSPNDSIRRRLEIIGLSQVLNLTAHAAHASRLGLLSAVSPEGHRVGLREV